VTPEILHGPLVYAAIVFAAVVEGEVAYVVAATLVGQGHLDALGVLLSGTAGAALGDQFYFYLLRGRLRRWLNRYESVARRAQRLVRLVRRYETPTVLLIRFAPGLRITLAAACAYADVAPLKFSILNVVASAVWAMVLLFLVAWVGPTYLPALGISGWWSALAPALLIVFVFNLTGRLERRALAHRAAELDAETAPAHHTEAAAPSE